MLRRAADRRLWLALAACFAFALSIASAQTPAPTPTEPYRAAADRPIDIQHIRLDLKVDLPAKTVDGRATIHLRALRPISSLSLNAVGFEVKKVLQGDPSQDGEPARFHHDGQTLTIDLDRAWPRGHAGVFRIDYRVHDPRDGLHFFGPSKSDPDLPLSVWSQGETTANRFWFPCFDHPDQRQSTELVVTVPEGYEAVSNGALVDRQPGPDPHTETFHWKQDLPHVSYLVTLAVAQFDVVHDHWNDVPVDYYVPRGRKADVALTFGRTPEMIDFFSKRFGIRFPWAKYDQVVVERFTFGGMENTSATTLTERALHDERAMIGSSPDSLIAHELAHQWWGDLLTCRDWAHTWLNEGFATYMEACWIEHHEGADEFAYNMLQKARAAITGGKERPIVDHRYPFPFAMFDSRTYPKGAWVLHMLRNVMGNDVFWKGIQRYGTDNRLRCVETADLRKALETESGRSLDRFFYDWTERPGNPVLHITSEPVADSHQLRIKIEQAQPGEAFQFPLKIAYHVEGRPQPLSIRETITDKEQVIYLPLPGRLAMLEFDPDQTLLAEFDETKSDDLWRTQLRQATGIISRIRAAQHLGKTKTDGDRHVLADALAAEKFWGVQAEIAAALGESGSDISRDALIQGLQSAHPKTRKACADALAKFRHDARAADALRELLKKGDPSYYVEAAALASYAKIPGKDVVALLTPWLDKPSHADVLRTSALEGLGAAHDLSALPTLKAWTRPGKPLACRVAAIAALAKLPEETNPSEAQREEITHAITDCLDGEVLQIRRAAVNALRDLGRAAQPALATLDAISQHDADEQVRDLAHKAAEQIRNATTAPPEVTRLREELDRLKRSQEELQGRLKSLERRETKSP